jgi:Protein of unknown function (DUF3105)
MPQKTRVKAPKQRTSQRHAAEAQAKKRRLYMFGGGTLVAVLAIVGIAALLGIGSGDPSVSDVREKVVAAGGTLREVKAQPGQHTLAEDERGKWNTDPPTSGPHFGFDQNQNLGTVRWGAYEEPLQLARVVHNLEHGGVYIFYGDKVPDSTIAELQAFYGDHVNGTLLAPYPKLGNQIALGAWVFRSEGDEKAYLAKLRKFDEDAFSAFFSAFQFKGPERFPASALLPGQG